MKWVTEKVLNKEQCILELLFDASRILGILNSVSKKILCDGNNYIVDCSLLECETVMLYR